MHLSEKYKAIVIGTSSGGMNALRSILPALPTHFWIPVIIVQHIAASSDSYWIEILNKECNVNIKEADEKERIEKGNVYIAPPNYHLLIEKDETLSLTVDERINFARPSIDVLFESAAEVYKNNLIGIILTGANRDGTAGIKKIKQYGGLTIVQDPKTAEVAEMPASAIAAGVIDHILPLSKIAAIFKQST